MIALFFVLLVSYFCYKTVSASLYWTKRKIPHVSPLSRIQQIYINDKSFAESLINIYYQIYPNLRYYGSYQFLEPSLFIRDLELAKQIAIRDFEYFTDHKLLTNDKLDPVLALNLFSLKGRKWHEMRTAVSPAFTGSKMRMMYSLMCKIADNFVEHFSAECGTSGSVTLEAKEAFSRYTNDVIASCAFGVDCDSFANPGNEFFAMGEMFMSTGIWRTIYIAISAFFPKISEILRIPTIDPKVLKFFQQLIRQSMELRARLQIVRPDLIHLLIEARKEQMLEENSANGTQYELKITEDVITAQALVFFIAGFTTSSSTLSFLCYELAVNEDVQQILLREIDEFGANYKNENIPYEELAKLKYLDQVIAETLRKYPPGYVLNRVCTKHYVIEPKTADEKRFVVEKGCLVAIPSIAFHYNPEYFPDPEKFNPDRFSEENKPKIVAGSYMPFGLGPRNCIGTRFAVQQIKTLMFKLLTNFEVVRVDKTKVPLRLDKSFDLRVKGGNWLAFKKRSADLTLY